MGISREKSFPEKRGEESPQQLVCVRSAQYSGIHTPGQATAHIALLKEKPVTAEVGADPRSRTSNVHRSKRPGLPKAVLGRCGAGAEGRGSSAEV